MIRMRKFKEVKEALELLDKAQKNAFVIYGALDRLAKTAHDTNERIREERFKLTRVLEDIQHARNILELHYQTKREDY